jgi:hypothetical protein
MPRKTNRPSAKPRKSRRLSIEADLRQIRATLERRLEMIHELQHTCAIQFQRMAQMQAELDEIKKAWQKVELTIRR